MTVATDRRVPLNTRALTLPGILPTAGRWDQSSPPWNLPRLRQIAAPPRRAQAALRSPSTCRNQASSWFQLTKIRLTTHILHRKAVSAEPSRSFAKARMRLGCGKSAGSTHQPHR